MMDYYDYGYGADEFIMGLLGVFFVTFALVGILSLVLYILRSIGIMTIANRRGMQNPWIIWIPVVGLYTVGAIADDIQAREGSRTIFRWLLLGGQVLATTIPFFSGFAAMGQLVSFIEHFDSYEYGDIPSMMTPFDMLGPLLWGPASLISLGVTVITIISLYYIYKCYKPESSTAYTVLSVIFPFLQSIFPFALRNRQPHWLNPPPPGYYGAPGGYPPSPEGFPGENPNPGFQYGPPPQDFGQPPQDFSQPPYGGYPGQGPGQAPPPPYDEQDRQ